VTFWKIATSALLALTWSLPAFATHEDRKEKRNEYREDVQIEGLAHELEQSARHIDRQLRNSRHGHHGRYERRAVRAVHRLKDTAKHFHRGIERNRNSSHHLSRDLRRVARAYRNAVYHVDRIHTKEHVRRDLRVVGSWINRISERYGAPIHHADFDNHSQPTGYDRFAASYEKQSSPASAFWSISWQSPEYLYSR
jgi:hypothetical protein